MVADTRRGSTTRQNDRGRRRHRQDGRGGRHADAGNTDGLRRPADHDRDPGAAVRVVHPIHKIMRLISSRALMGDALNGRAVNVISGVTTVAILGASAGLIATSLPQSGRSASQHQDQRALRVDQHRHQRHDLHDDRRHLRNPLDRGVPRVHVALNESKRDN